MSTHHKGPRALMTSAYWKNVKIPPELHRRLRIAAAEQDRTVQEIVCAVLGAWLDHNDAHPPPVPSSTTPRPLG